MARYVDAVDLPRSMEEAFDYLADFSRTAEWDPGVVEARRSVDEITFVPRPGDTRVTYDARLELTGIRRLADPFLDVLFQRIGCSAVRGLSERLARESGEEAASKEARSARKSDEQHRKRAKGVRSVRTTRQKGVVAR